MGNSVGYKGHPGLQAARSKLLVQREADRAAAEARLRELQRAASPIVVPAPRRMKREATPEAAPVEEPTNEEES